MKSRFQDWGVRIWIGIVCVRSGPVESSCGHGKGPDILFTNQLCDHRILKKDSASWT
jgi:hypothetical protein